MNLYFGFEYKELKGKKWSVYLDGKKMGVIHKLGEKQFQYWPGDRKKFAGEIYTTFGACKMSLEYE